MAVIVSATINEKAFSGPFDLLLHLLDKRELSILDIPIAELADSFLETLQQIDTPDMDALSEFIVMAAFLLEMKSKTLLPSNKAEAQEVELSKEALALRLSEFKRFKQLSVMLNERYNTFSGLLFREKDRPLIESLSVGKAEAAILNGISPELLMDIFQDVKRRQAEQLSSQNPSKPQIPTYAAPTELFSVHDKLIEIRSMLASNGQMSMDKLLRGTKSERIVAFLALLEMIKQRIVLILDTNGGISVEGVGASG